MAILPQGPSSTLTNDYNWYLTDRKKLMEKSFNEALLISTDLDSEYLPLFAMFRGKHSSVISMGEELRYSTYWLDPSSSAIVKNIALVIAAFNTCVKPIKYTRENVEYYIQKHCIYTISEGQIVVLFCTVVEKDYWRLIPENFEVDKNKFLMVINNQFLTAKYKAFYTYFTKFIMNPLLSSETIDFVITSDITKYCFKPIEIPMHFTTIAEMKTYLNTINDGATEEFIARG